MERECQELLKLKAFKTRGDSPQIFHSEEIDPEFLAFQEDLELLDTRIAELRLVLKGAQIIVPPPKDKQHLVGLGSTIVVEIDGQKDELRIVGAMEANPSIGNISNECLVGKILLGHKAGDEIAVGSGPKVVYKIKSVKYEKIR